jgi:peptidoglycan/LPS O-acetylase OafA/YrhL
MTQVLLRAEIAGVVFWLVSIVALTQPSRTLIVVWHLVALGLSFFIPTYSVSDQANLPSPMGVQCTLLGLLNGLLALGWCSRLDGRASRWPLVGITVTGVLLPLLIGVSSFKMTRMF